MSPHRPRGSLLGSLGKEARRAPSSQISALLASIFPESELSSSGFDRPQRLGMTGAGRSLFHQSPHWPWTPQAGGQVALRGWMMVRKNGQQGQRPKKAVQVVCPTLPLHANLCHTHSSQDSLLSHALPAHSHQPSRTTPYLLRLLSH